MLHDSVRHREQLLGRLAGTLLRLGGLRPQQALARRLQRGIKRRQLAGMRGDGGVDLVETFPRLRVAGVGSKRDGSTLVGKFGAALDASSSLRLKIGNYSLSLFNSHQISPLLGSMQPGFDP